MGACFGSGHRNCTAAAEYQAKWGFKEITSGFPAHSRGYFHPQYFLWSYFICLLFWQSPRSDHGLGGGEKILWLICSLICWGLEALVDSLGAVICGVAYPHPHCLNQQHIRTHLTTKARGGSPQLKAQHGAGWALLCRGSSRSGAYHFCSSLRQIHLTHCQLSTLMLY